MIYKLQNGRTIPLGGDYLEYLQSIPETYGGSIQPSVKVESLPKKFNGSQQAARTYAEGYLKGSKPVTKAIDNAGQKIFNTTKNIAMFVPGPTGAITWLGQMGADTANGEYSKVAKDLGAAVLIGAGLKGAQAGAKAAGRALAGKGVNIPWLDAYDYSALRNEYFTNVGNKAMAKATPDIVQMNIEAGKLGWAPSSKQTLWHNSDQPLTKLEINFPAWDTTQRGAPLGHSWFTGTETTEGFLGSRPYHLKGNVELNKPMVQLGEAIGNGKNNTRNQILDFAQKSSADAINFKNIADNTLQNQNVYSVFKNVDLNNNLKLDDNLRTRGSSQEAATTYHWDPRVKVLSRPISNAEKKGIVKHERPMHDPEVLEKAKLFAEEYGYPEPKTPEEIKNMYRRHNTFFRTVADLDRTYFPEPYEAMPDWFKQLDLPGQRKILASRGYPSNSAFRGYYENANELFADGFVFASPSLEQNADYFINGTLDNTVKLQRPFSLRDPKTWHKEADWRIYPKNSLKEQFWPKGRIEIGNASPTIEFKVSTKHLIPVDIAKPDDLGTLLPDYLQRRVNEGIRKDWYKRPKWLSGDPYYGNYEIDYFGILPEKFNYKQGGKIK